MYRSALRVTESHEDAEEAFQEASLSAYRKLKQFQGESQLRTWLIRIAINHALMIRRKRKADRVVPLIFESADGESAYDPADLRPNPEQSCYRREMDRKLRMAIERLSPTLRSAFVLRHVDELTPSQAAAALGVSVPAFKSRLMRARQALQRRLLYAVEPAVERRRGL
jgi:RNA polymerase sigma-70 factor (ECF subfamily)